MNNNNAGYSKITSAHKSRSVDFSSAGGERFGVILGRTGSVSSAASSSSSSGGFLKKAFSMRRSSSVSERYCRIHDQYMALTSPEIDVPVKPKKKHSNGREGSKIFKACKRLLGL